MSLFLATLLARTSLAAIRNVRQATPVPDIDIGYAFVIIIIVVAPHQSDRETPSKTSPNLTFGASTRPR